MLHSVPLGAVDTPEERKARGAFFTPPEICSFISAWAIRERTDRVLEPSCGEAAFLVSAGDRLRSLGVAGDTAKQIHTFDQLQGIELHEVSALGASAELARVDVPATIHIGNFFDAVMAEQFEAVIGNPPYVRYQDFSGDDRRKARERALKLGVPLSGLASSWAAFVVHATQFLKPDGRLGLVLPAELLSVNYAGPVRSFLMRRFASVRLIMFEQRVFPGVMEEVVLLLAEGVGPTDHFTVHQLQDLAGLADVDRLAAAWRPENSSAKWVPALLPPGASEKYLALADVGSFCSLETWGDTYLGMVTGNNRYFTLTADEVREAGLGEHDLRRICPPGSRHLRGLTFTTSAWEEMSREGRRVHLFYPDSDTPSAAARRYIEKGEAAGVEKAYKCRVRKPWWRVPTVPEPHLFLTYMNYDTPRLVRNEARVPFFVNSIHGVRFHHGFQTTGQDLLPLAALNSMTLLGAEVVGRSYGGGMLKLEPKEADVLPVPSKETVEACAPGLRAIRPQLGQSLRQGDLATAVSMVDNVLLVDGLGMKRSDVKVLRAARDGLFDRRAARS